MIGSTAPLVLTQSEKLLIVLSVTSLVPVKLDVDKLKYSSWIFFFKNLCNGFEVTKHILGDSTGESFSAHAPPTTKWLKTDSIVK